MARKYSMDRRSTTVDETRRRIVEATMALHDEKGILGTSMQDIAARADVALGTVYRHFPSIEDLVPACGGRNMELNPPPTRPIFADLTTRADRVRALIAAYYAHYAYNPRMFEVGLAEAPKLPVLAAFMEEGVAHLQRLVAEAVAPAPPESDVFKLAVALCSFWSWQALTQAGFESNAAARLAAGILAARLGPDEERGGT